jgi:hypothetical protein
VHREQRLDLAEVLDRGAVLVFPVVLEPVAPLRERLARLRLEDVFIRIVAEGARDGDARALRASLLAPGAEGALV